MKHFLKTFAYIYLTTIAISVATVAFLTDNYFIAVGVGFIGNLVLENYVVYRINRDRDFSDVEQQKL